MGKSCAKKPGSKHVLDLIARIRQPELIEEENGTKKND